MKNKILHFKRFHNERGGMMIELLLTLALVGVILPFIVDFQTARITRDKNIVIANDIEVVRNGLEKYLGVNKKEFMKTVGKNITRINLIDLSEYGVPDNLIKKYNDEFQIRIIKSIDRNNHSTLQGVVVLNDKDISPVRTREIINLGNGDMGFVEQNRAFGAFGTWHGDAVDFGVQGMNGIVDKTKTHLNSESYLWRLPSENDSDSLMMSNLNLGGHNIIGAKFMDSDFAKFNEILKTEKLVSTNITFQNRTTVDKNFDTSDAVVLGALSSDSKNIDISETLTLADTAKFSNFQTNDLWATNLTLSGLSVSSENSNQASILKINQTVDMIAGHITAMTVSIGFDGSITPRLVINNRIEDSTNSNYFWDASDKTANFVDVSLAELSRMAILITKKEYDSNTKTSQMFNSVVTNKNATGADFMNMIPQIQTQVKLKYNQLNLD